MFTKEEGLWIALHCEDESPTKLKRKFCKVFNVQHICNAVDEICSNTSAEMVNKSIASVLKRAKMCLEVSGGHFQCRKSFV